MNAQEISVKSPEYEYGFHLAHAWAVENAGLDDLDHADRHPNPWDEIGTEAGAFWDWDERQDADYVSGFNDGYRAAFDRAARLRAYIEADRIDLNGREA